MIKLNKLFYVPLVILVLPYYLYSTYFFIECQLARGKGPEAGYRVLGMLPMLQDVYWGSMWIAFWILLAFIFVKLIKPYVKND